MIVIDIEASGLDHRKHSLVSIGAVDFEDPNRQYYAEPRIWDGALMDDTSLAICGFTKEECVDPKKRSLEETMHDFYSWLEPISERTLVGQNPSFDRDFLNSAFGRAKMSWNFSYRTIDIHSLAYFDHIKRGIPVPMEKNRTALNLDGILSYVGIPDEPKPHNALTGAKVEAETLSRLLYGRSLLPEFEEFPIPDYLTSNSS